MQTLNRSPRWIGALCAFACATLASAAQAVTPAQPSGHPSQGAAATALKSALPDEITPSQSAPKWQSGVGEWVGAPCRLIIQKDDGRNVEADCFTASLHHYYKARYVSSDLIEGTVTRVDPTGCEVAVPMTVHISDANNFEFTHPGFTGCGVNNAGPANAYPVRRAQPVATSSATNPTGGSNSTGATNSRTTTASTTSQSKSAASTSGQAHAAGSATPATTAATGAKAVTPATAHAATATNTPPKKVAVAAKPVIKPPVKLPLKTEGQN